MAGGNRTAVGGMRFGDHLYLAYDNGAERHAVLAAYLRGGLRAGHALLYLADGEPAEAVRDRLRAVFAADDPDLLAALNDGRLAVPATAGRPAGEMIAAAGGRGAGVRVTVEASPASRGWPGTDGFAAFEDAVGRAVARTGDAMALCQFDRRWFGSGLPDALDACHGGRAGADAVFDDGALRIDPLFAPPGLRLSGSIDESTLPGLLAALRGLDDRAAHVCLDLAGVEFCDLAGLRALVGVNEWSIVPDRLVVLRSAPRCVEMMMRVTGWEGVPGIVREGAR
ncbi:MEDS domain-containing protein [Actinomadura opuntiae]|uniref:MEDS domain-containing protein n=1 Tax=Actinomadura sp. OS1-43 TaxID=604315 RepID=UPI00255AFC49|nr:MEDS domain-containing protein [Actinomadura sp. OS1-43]MDL4821868.1 MEDS domain-containing protein [Actinomadura sp. OS1-43]